MATMERFTLDETRAREWLRRAVQAFSEGHHAGGQEELPEIGGNWDPVTHDEESTVYLMVRLAADAGIIAGPDDTDVDFEYMADSDGGYYQFMVRLGSRLKLASPAEEMRRLGARDTVGLAAAMAILREAVASANGVLEALAEYEPARRIDRMDERDIRYHSSDDMSGLGEFRDVMEPVAVVIRPGGSVDVYGYVAVIDPRCSRCD